MNTEIYRSAPVNCTDCSLSTSRTQIVYPDILNNSDDNLRILVIGEAPGQQEDEQGKPFIGRSGQLLRKELTAMPGTVIITNVVKCRPPENRDPSVEEKSSCRKYLMFEVDHYKPDLFLLVGRHAVQTFLPAYAYKSILAISGSIIENKMIPILHPAATLYNPKNKEVWTKTWEKVREHINVFSSGQFKAIKKNLPTKKDLISFIKD